MKGIIIPLFCLIIFVSIASVSAEDFEISPEDLSKLLEFSQYLDDPFINIPPSKSTQFALFWTVITFQPPDFVSPDEANDDVAVVRMVLLAQNTTETKKTLTLKETMPSIVINTKVYVLEADSFSLDPEDILNLKEAKTSFNKTTKEISIPIEIEANATEIYMIYATCKGVEHCMTTGTTQ
ncbi:MAG: hypothetical protein AMQ74_01613 [Candidatus Methanofastidiosum methylothiophilum]|uniref:Uncharacterized protein n=1 Tax=Candidatus Methanofastidiosum methylothiophilum TaxID=1705564 RepID=A0A150ITC9_9EURY|nr:MAG: hypothetical protein AMQ74_01613 [Candidatus Methanofastidiosum methylthiophilus]